ncbi:hypothetical protein H0H81_010170 [Sphagnurus paluster]|uniref:Pesticidal crystal protein domain-containing protein n=1 Tax=Sphagnurus paluster TaxID=117069 RepID=A0A9P7GI45_9AGAR|nr:hypothetical protein H0H81_010170 [Sphagnurus paluster]
MSIAPEEPILLKTQYWSDYDVGKGDQFPSLPSSPPASPLEELPFEEEKDGVVNVDKAIERSPFKPSQPAGTRAALPDLRLALSQAAFSSAADPLNALIFNVVGTVVEVGLGMIPGPAGPFAGAIFALFWGQLTSNGSQQDSFTRFHDQVLDLVRRQINLNNVQEQIRQGRERLEGIQNQAHFFRSTYIAWANNPDAGNAEFLRTQFQILFSALIDVLPVYWNNGNHRFLIHMGSVVMLMTFALLRDGISEGWQWGFTHDSIDILIQQLRFNRNAVVLACRQIQGLDFASAASFLYMDPTFEFLGRGQREVRFARGPLANTWLSADAVHVVDGRSLMNVRQSGVQIHSPVHYGGLSHQSAILVHDLPTNPLPDVVGVLGFDRDGMFDIRILRLLSNRNGQVSINGVLFRFRDLEIDEEDWGFYVIRSIVTVSQRIVFQIKRVGDGGDRPTLLGDVVITPS